MNKAAVLIAIPSGDNLIHGDTVLSIYNMISTMNTPSLLGAGLTISANAMVHDSRNKMIEEILEDKGYSHILFVDSDMTIPKNGLEILLQADKDVVGGLCFSRRVPIEPTVYDRVIDNGKDMYVNIHSYPKDQLFEVDATGAAFLLVKREVMDKLGKGAFTFNDGYGEDINFCRRVKEAGFSIWVDSRAKIGHIGNFEIDEKMYNNILAMSSTNKEFAKMWGLAIDKPIVRDEEKEDVDPFADINRAGAMAQE